ncbi:erythromycin esterase family protein [Undibacterium sp. Di27W]|uniref:erythromycin esterase family protein n=1 Tax=Undibacterium sp. Di27W TaxID=3413036 RepID=UPI003BF093E0
MSSRSFRVSSLWFQKICKPFFYSGLALTVYGLASPACAHELAVKNLGFEEWPADQTLPTGWKVIATAHTVSADCQIAKEGKCSVRLESQAQTSKDSTTALAQTLIASTIYGHPLILSGWIKTQDVKGQAEIFLQVDSKAKSAVAESSLNKLAPRANQDWQRFSIRVPVAANATVVHIGIGLKGKGTAWFDGMTLEVDESTKVADLPEVKRPVRPQKNMQLDDDQSMALAAKLIPHINTEWQAGIRQDVHGLRSLFSEDFSDLQFLKPLLKGKRLVQLGESGHGIAEFNWMKVRLVKFLHQEMGFDVIAMEASMTTSDAMNQNVAQISAGEAMTSSQFATIGTLETLDLFEYVKQSQAGKHGLILAGFDNQNSGWKSSIAITARFKSLLSLIDTDLAGQIDGMEKELENLSNNKKMSMSAEELAKRYKTVADKLDSERAKLLAHDTSKQAEVLMSIQEARARVKLCQQLVTPGMNKTGMEIRDLAMADNLNFLLDTIYPQKKIMVWAHNTHIANAWVDQESPKTMGVWMAEKRRKEMYTIGLYMGRGTLGSYGKDVYSDIDAPPAGSMESILANGGLKMSFVDFSQAKPSAANSWMFAPINARFWGRNPEVIVPAKAYDAVIYIDTVTPSEYWK